MSLAGRQSVKNRKTVKKTKSVKVISQDISKFDLSVNLKPTESALKKVIDLHTAIDTLIIHDCFDGNNPMRKEQGSSLFWDWAILNVNGLNIPMPYHTMSDTTSYLYTYNGEEVHMSHEECVITNSVFYLTYLYSIRRYIIKNEGKIDPFIMMALEGGLNLIDALGDQGYAILITQLKSKLTNAGHKVLD